MPSVRPVIQQLPRLAPKLRPVGRLFLHVWLGVRPLLQAVARHARTWYKARARECNHCRSCGQSVAPLAEICPACGASGPAKLSTTAGVAVVAGMLVLLAFGLWLT